MMDQFLVLGAVLGGLNAEYRVQSSEYQFIGDSCREVATLVKELGTMFISQYAVRDSSSDWHSVLRTHKMRPWMLADLNYGVVRSQPPFELAVLPLGATEPHNLHLPYGTDTLQVELIAQRACAKAFEQGARVVLLPALPFGTETNQMRFPLAMNLNPTTVAQVVTDLVESLATHKIYKCLLLNGHGGNDLKWVLRQLFRTTPVHLFLCNWYKVASDRHKTLFEEAGDHAGELETSMGLAHFPELVALDQADSGSMAPTRFEAINRGWVEITRPWHLLTTNSGAGDPRPATAAKGEVLTELVVARIASFLTELSASPLDDRFPF